MVNTIYLFSFVEIPRKFIIAIINLRGVSTKLNKYNVNLVFHVFQDGFEMFTFARLASEPLLER